MGKDNLNIRFGQGLADEGLKFFGRTPEYCGQELTRDGKTYISAYASSALTLGKVYQLTYSQTAGQEVQTATPATIGGPTITAVARRAEKAGDIVWLQKGGQCEAYVEGTTDVAAGDFLEVLNGENDFKKDGSALSENSAAVAVDAQSDNSAVLVTVMLINKVHQIAAS